MFTKYKKKSTVKAFCTACWNQDRIFMFYSTRLFKKICNTLLLMHTLPGLKKTLLCTASKVCVNLIRLFTNKSSSVSVQPDITFYCCCCPTKTHQTMPFFKNSTRWINLLILFFYHHSSCDHFSHTNPQTDLFNFKLYYELCSLLNSKDKVFELLDRELDQKDEQQRSKIKKRKVLLCRSILVPMSTSEHVSSNWDTVAFL